MSDELSYYDVVVTIAGKEHRIADNYAYQLGCSRARGWSLWWKWEGEEKCLGEEFGRAPFKITVGGNVIVDSKGSR